MFSLILGMAVAGFSSSAVAPNGYRLSKISSVKEGYWSASAEIPKFKELSPLIAYANKNLAHEMRAAFDEFVTGAKQDLLPPSGQKPDRGNYAYEAKSEVILLKPDLVSVLITTYADTLGAHPNTYLSMFNYGLVGGSPARLRLRDLFQPGTEPLNVVDQVVTPILRTKGASDALDASFHLSSKLGEQFVLEPDGLRYWFAPYDVAYYAMGSFTAKVPFAQIKGLNKAGPLGNLLK